VVVCALSFWACSTSSTPNQVNLSSSADGSSSSGTIVETGTLPFGFSNDYVILEANPITDWTDSSFKYEVGGACTGSSIWYADTGFAVGYHLNGDSMSIWDTRYPTDTTHLVSAVAGTGLHGLWTSVSGDVDTSLFYWLYIGDTATYGVLLLNQLAEVFNPTPTTDSQAVMDSTGTATLQYNGKLFQQKRQLQIVNGIYTGVQMHQEYDGVSCDGFLGNHQLLHTESDCLDSKNDEAAFYACWATLIPGHTKPRICGNTSNENFCDSNCIDLVVERSCS